MKFKISIVLLLTFFLTTNCDTNDDLEVPQSLQINDFVWKGMNLYYLWQNEVPNLQDTQFSNQDQLNNFLSGYSNPINLFNALRVPTTLDRFSVIFDNYNNLEGILSGNTLNNGVDFALKYKTGSTTELFGYVRYIIPNSDASAKNIQRGDLFYAVNGIPITVSNYQELLANTNYTLNLADFDNGNITPNGDSVALTKTNLSENPVLISNVINEGNHKIGYLVYNGFYLGYESQLNNAFSQLKNQQITDLVLDLRYNSGGSIATATRLASMITGQFNGQLFAKEQWNSKLQAYWNDVNPAQLVNNFTNKISNGNPISSLNLTKIYILTSKSTASASELIINGLKPYINVIQIGDVTTGKNVGSITLYDSPSFKKYNASSKHKYAMQPIVFKTVNKAGFGDYQQGLQPNFLIIEDLGNLGVLGNQEEPLLSEAITQILANGKQSEAKATTNFQDFKTAKEMNLLQSDMFTEFK